MDRRDRVRDTSLTDDDELALDAILRQLDRDYPHSTEPVAPSIPVASRPRKRLATVLSVLLVCASGVAAAVLLTPMYQALNATQRPLDLESPPAAAAPVTTVLATATPVTPAQPPVRADARVEPVGRAPATPAPQPSVPAVTRLKRLPPPSAPTALVTAPPSVDAEAPVAAAPAVVAAPRPGASPAVTAPPAVAAAPPIAGPPAVDAPATPAKASVTSSPPLESVVAALAALPLARMASEQVQAVWGTVKEGVLRATGDLPQGRQSGPEAP